MNCTCKEHKHLNLYKELQGQRTSSHALCTGTPDAMAKQNQALKEIPALL